MNHNTSSLTRRVAVLTEDNNDVRMSWVTEKPVVIVKWLSPVTYKEEGE